MAHKFLFVVTKKPENNSNKFTVELRLGNVDYHKDMVLSSDYCALGGGEWRINDEEKWIRLSGCSDDFGYPEIESIEKVIIPEEWKDYKIFYRFDWWMEKEDLDISAICEVGDCVYM